MLKEGQKAPAFRLESGDGAFISLSEFKGKTIVLYFYPKDLGYRANDIRHWADWKSNQDFS